VKIRSLNEKLWNQLSLDELERRDEFGIADVLWARDLPPVR
jgi:hypothetical protein